VLSKFFEVATMQQKREHGSMNPHLDSSKVTAAIVNQVSKEFKLMQAHAMRAATHSRSSSSTYEEGVGSQRISIPQVHLISSSQLKERPNKQDERPSTEETMSSLGMNQPLTVSVPLKAGPTKNIYQFTQLRDQYKNKFV